MGVSNHAGDQHNLVPVLQRFVANSAQLPESLITDAG